MTKPRTSPKPVRRANDGPSSGSEGPEAHIPPLRGARREATQARSRETVSAILEAAARLLEESGFRSASTNAIARRAGVSIGSLYQFFASREDIYRTLMAQHRAWVHACAADSWAPVVSGAMHPAAALPGLLRDMVELHSVRPGLMHAMATELAHLDGGGHRRHEASELAEMMAMIADRLPGKVETARAKAWMAVEITAHLARRLAHEPPEGVAALEVEAALGGLMEHLLGASSD